MRRVVAAAGEIGIKITLAVVTEDALNNLIYAPGPNTTMQPNFDAFYWAWIGDPTPDFNFSVLQTGSAWTDSYYSNPAYDKLVDEALVTQDFGKRVDLLHQAEKIAMTDLPYIPIVYAVTYDLTRTDTWHGYLASPTGDSGSPIGTNWLQVTQLAAGPEAPTPVESSGAVAATSGASAAGGEAAASPTAPSGSETAAEPATTATGSATATVSTGGVPTWLVVVLIVVVVVLIVLVVVMVRRGKGGRANAEDPDDEPFN